MVEILDTGTPRVLGFRLQGRITEDDLDVFGAALQEALRRQPWLNLYVDAAEVGEPAEKAVIHGLRAWSCYGDKLRACALVGDRALQPWAARALGPSYLRLPLRFFAPSERRQASLWLGMGAVPQPAVQEKAESLKF